MTTPTTLSGIRQFVTDVEDVQNRALLRGAISTLVILDSTDAADGVIGDCVCISPNTSQALTTPIATRALPAVLASAGRVFGVLIEPILRGNSGLCAVMGVLPKSITGLSLSSGKVRVSPLGRCERVTDFADGDSSVGTVDVAGNLTISTEIVNVSNSTPGGDPTIRLVSSPVAVQAVLSGTGWQTIGPQFSVPATASRTLSVIGSVTDVAITLSVRVFNVTDDTSAGAVSGISTMTDETESGSISFDSTKTYELQAQAFGAVGDDKAGFVLSVVVM